MVYEYLPKIPKVNKDGYVDLSCTNSFIQLNKPIIDTAESIIKMKFPSELRQFYEEVGYGNLTTPMNPLKDYSWLIDISWSIDVNVNKVYSDVANLKSYRKVSKNEPFSTPS